MTDNKLNFEEMEDFSPEQKEMRASGVTASEIGAVAGLNPYSTIYKVWEEKMKLIERPDLSDVAAIQRGKFLERPIMRWTSYTIQKWIRPNRETVRHPESEIALATPDGYVEESETEASVYEGKSPGVNTYQDWELPEEIPDGIPGYVIPQVIWQQGVTGLTEQPAVVAALIGGALRIYKIPWDEELWDMLLRKAEWFMGLVRNGKEPPYDGTSLAAEYVKSRYNQQEVVDLVEVSDVAWSDKAREFARLKTASKAMGEELKIRAGEFQAEIQHHAGMEGPGFKATWMSDKNGRTQWKKVAQELADRYKVPEHIFENVVHDNRSFPTRRFSVKVEEK